MALDPLQVKVAEAVCARFTSSRRPVARKELVLLVRDGYVLDEMANRTLIRTDSNRAQYFPTLGTFALLDDTDERLIAAHEATVRILRILLRLYETRDGSHTYTSDELIEEVRLHEDTVDPQQVRLGLYLSIAEFGAIQGWKPSEDGLDIESITIAESVLKVTDPEVAWSRRIALSRNNASDRPRYLVPEEPPEEPTTWDDDIEMHPAPFQVEAVPAVSTGITVIKSENPGTLAISEEGNPRVFISYSWDSDEHQEWVLTLATRLRQEGVDVVLDEWNLGLGENRFHFMERSVVSAEFILLVCTPIYAEKSNDREGGVGYESNIITTQIAEKTDKQKFIPVLRAGDWKSALPVWLKHMVGCNLSADPYSESEYRKLLRTLHRQQAVAPALGPRPSFPQQTPQPMSPDIDLPANPAPRFDHSLKDELSAKERELLDAAINDPNGQISHRRPIGPESLMANGKSFIERGKARSAAAWLGALHALEQRGLIRPASPDRHFYQVTDRGYETADRLGHFVRWTTTEILLEAYYMNAPKKSISIQCSGVVEVPQVFYPNEYGNGDSGMRSIKHHRSLLVEDVQPGVLANVDWQPTDVSFVDAASNDKKEFRISLTESPELSTLLLEMST
jgi:TIR domain